MTDKMTTTEKGALAPTAPSSVLPAAPDYIPRGSRLGFEDTEQDDISIPRLTVTQALHPQVTDGDPKRIEGLKVGDLFNSVTGQNYGREVTVQLLRKLPLRAMEFNSIDDGGGVKDPNVPMTLNNNRSGHPGKYLDDRLNYHGDDKPVATIFRDFIAVILPQREIIALSFKSSGLTAAKNMWGLATMSNRDCFAVKMRITTAPKLTPKPHQIYKVELAGWVSEVDYLLGKEQYEAVKTISAEKIDRSDAHDDDPDAFELAQFEGARQTDM